MPEYRQELASSHYNLGRLLNDRAYVAEAEAAYRRALEIQEKLSADIPTVPAFRQELASSYSRLGSLLKVRGKVPEVEASYRRALEIQEKLWADFPTVPRYESDIAGTLRSLGLVVEGREGWQEARTLYERAIVIHRKILAAEPGSDRTGLRSALWFTCNPCIQMGDHTAALNYALELPKLYPEGWEEYHRAADYVARCISLAGKDPSLTPPQRQQTAESYGQQAVQLLGQAIAHGYKDVTKLKTSFLPLRARPDFQALLLKETGGP